MKGLKEFRRKAPLESKIFLLFHWLQYCSESLQAILMLAKLSVLLLSTAVWEAPESPKTSSQILQNSFSVKLFTVSPWRKSLIRNSIQICFLIIPIILWIFFFLLSYACHFFTHCILSSKTSSSVFPYLEKFKYQLKEIYVSQD